MSAPTRNNIDIVIGACDLRTGSAFRFGNRRTGSWRIGEVSGQDLPVAVAIAASAAYPILLPALDRTWTFRRNGDETRQRVVLTDGGVYDNLGIQVLEPGRDQRFSLHTYPCDHVIACNAGHGQEPGTALPMGFYSRVSQSFSVVHRRVQDSAMTRLHHLRQTGALRGFVMPYLGQQDDRLPWQSPDLVTREEVLNYPTNFAAMSPEWIDKLSARGDQLTRLLIPYYLPELLH